MKSSDIKLCKVSSKGQVVIPETIRSACNVREGDLFAASVHNNLIVLKKMKSPFKKEDEILLKEIEKGWKEIEEGKSTSVNSEKFLEELKSW